jgi:hypothetical protein
MQNAERIRDSMIAEPKAETLVPQLEVLAGST